MQPDDTKTLQEGEPVEGGNAARFQIGRGAALRCRGWRQEGLLRMLENTLHNGERPQDLVIYAGTGKVARNWQCFHAIVRALETLAEDETLVIQSGKPVAVFRTSERAPRVLAANTNLVGKWATWEHFRELEGRGLMMYGQYTAGTWAYIGTQGILQGTYETFAAAGAQLPGGSLAGHIVLTAGLGGMGGAQPLAVRMAGGVCVAVEVDRARAERRFQSGYCDVIVDDPVEAIRCARRAAGRNEPLGIALIGNAADLYGRLRDLGLAPSVVTDQTSAHDPLNGYIPLGVSPDDAEAARAGDPKRYVERSLASMARQVEAMLAYQADGAITFEYGNYIRGHAMEAGVANANDIQGFVPLFIRPGFCRGRGPFRWVCLSGDPADLKATDGAVQRLLPDDVLLSRWMKMAETHVPIQGLPARTCWLALGERDKAGLLFNDMVKRGELRGPIAMSRDHLDAGSVAQPSRETEGMLDGSDAIADWPLLNALLNTANGADLVTIHQGAGSGMGGSISAGMTIIADGTESAAQRIARALYVDPAIGVVRHADAGYEIAKGARKAAGLVDPMAGN
jgi:urocanate hydratase